MTQSNSSSNSLQSSETDSKLVSIICRTVNRPELGQALASIAEQNYPNIEVVLIDALDQGIDLQLEDVCPDRSITLVSGLGKLPRSAAANAGLDNAKGDYLLFLDDDDWIAANHISNLVELLEGSSGVLAVYSSARKANAAGAMLEHVFSHEFDRALLRRDNFIPIHAVLFSAALLQRGCRFDESMDIYEDWDFWLQVSQHGDLLHHDGITAFYREGGDSETAVDSERVKYRADHPNALAREKVLQKWLASWSAADVNQMLGTMDQSAAIAELKQNVDAAHELISARNEELVELEHAHRRLKDELLENFRQLSLAHHELIVQHEELDARVRELLGSFSWRVTKPYRYLSQRIKTHILTPILGPLKKNTVKVVLKNPTLHQAVRDVRANLPGAESRPNDKLHYGLDSPSEDHKIFSDSLTLRGWAMLESGAVSLTSYIDDLEFRAFTPSQPRPDVEELFPWLDHAGSSGFTEEISLRFLPSGAHSLRLVARSAAGFKAEIHQDFYLLRDNELYSAWFDYQTWYIYNNEPKNIHGDTVVHILLSGSAEPAATLASIDSVLKQSFANWRLHYLGDNWPSIQELLSSEQRLALGDKLNVAGELASAVTDCDADQDFLLGLAGGELLMPNALAELLSCAQISASEVVYCDHDRITAPVAGAMEHTDPVFTFSWSPDQLLSQNYVGDVFLFSAAILDRAFLQSCSNSSWRYALLLEFGQQSRSIQRLAKVLWSASPIEAEPAEARLKQEQATVEDYLRRHAPQAKVETVEGIRSVDWPLLDEPSVAIIIPTMGKLELIQPCLDSLVEKTRYKNYQVIMLDNSRGKFPAGINYLHEKHFEVIECDEAFNWARLNNIGATASSTDYLLFLNDDIEITESDWLHALVKQAQRSDVGAVGGLLLYPNGAIQHAGVFMVNQGGGCAHLFHKMTPGDNIYQNLHRTTREVSANTGACLLLAREKFEALNGFDEELAIVGNDIDLCLRLSAAGYRNIWTPQCSLIHHESISRKATVPKRDEEAMWKRWRGEFEAGDPYYNPNLTLEKWDCSLRLNMPAADLIEQVKFVERDRQAKPQDSLLEGVNLIGYIRAEMGVGEGARSDARAFAAGGTEFGIINFETANPARMTDLSWQHKEMLSAPYDINLIHINADYLPLAKQELPAHFFQDRYNIAYWAWELEEIPEQWLASFDEVDEVWVPSDFVKQAIERNSPVPVVTIPHCVDVKPQYQFSRKDFEIPEQAFVFISMFDTHSMAERKNPYAAVKAFKQAFAGDNENVCLILKVNNSKLEKLEQLRESIQSHPNILVLDQTHSREQINALLQLSDCFVSLHRSEGFGLGPAEAMCLGKATILTNWSGSTDYMTEQNCKPIGYELITIKKTQGPYKAGQRWADPDIDEAAEAMADLVSNPELVAAIGEAAKATIKDHFSPAAVGKLVNARLKAIREARR